MSGRDTFFDEELEKIFNLFYDTFKSPVNKEMSIIDDLYGIYENIRIKALTRPADIDITKFFNQQIVSAKRFQKNFANKWLEYKKTKCAEEHDLEETSFITDFFDKIPGGQFSAYYTICTLLFCKFSKTPITSLNTDLEIEKTFELLGVKHKYISKLLSPDNNHYGLRLVRRKHFNYAYE